MPPAEWRYSVTVEWVAWVHPFFTAPLHRAGPSWHRNRTRVIGEMKLPFQRKRSKLEAYRMKLATPLNRNGMADT